MKTPWQSVRLLSPRQQAEVRLRTIFECGKSDVQCEDSPVLAPLALVLEKEAWSELAALAEQLAAEAAAAEDELLERPDLHSKLGLPFLLRHVLKQVGNRRRKGRTVRVMRFDFHFTTEGWRISEVNSDVPGGFLEAGGLSEIVAACFPETRGFGSWIPEPGGG